MTFRESGIVPSQRTIDYAFDGYRFTVAEGDKDAFGVIQIPFNATEGGEINHCSKFVVVIGSESCRTRMNESNPERCICVSDIVESKIFKTGQNGPLCYESAALTS
jgi:hypothetical protein